MVGAGAGAVVVVGLVVVVGGVVVVVAGLVVVVGLDVVVGLVVATGRVVVVGRVEWLSGGRRRSRGPGRGRLCRGRGGGEAWVAQGRRWA